MLLTFDQDIEFKQEIENLLFDLINKKASIAEKYFLRIYYEIIDTIEEYIQKKNIIFISIWDQVNSCYDSKGELKKDATEKDNDYYPLPAYFHYQGIFPRLQNQINICGASFNNSSKLTRFKNEKNQDINWHKYPFLNSFSSVNEKRVLLEFFTPFKKLFNSIEIKQQNGEKLDLDVNQTVTLVDKWTNMLPLSIALLSQELEKATVNDQNSTDFNTTFDFFICNQKKIIACIFRLS